MVCQCDFFTGATITDRTVAEELISGFQAKYLLADRGYDTDATIRFALQAGMTPVMPPKKNRKFCATTISMLTSCDISSRMLLGSSRNARHCKGTAQLKKLLTQLSVMSMLARGRMGIAVWLIILLPSLQTLGDVNKKNRRIELGLIILVPSLAALYKARYFDAQKLAYSVLTTLFRYSLNSTPISLCFSATSTQAFMMPSLLPMS